MYVDAHDPHLQSLVLTILCSLVHNNPRVMAAMAQHQRLLQDQQVRQVMANRAYSANLEARDSTRGIPMETFQPQNGHSGFENASNVVKSTISRDHTLGDHARQEALLTYYGQRTRPRLTRDTFSRLGQAHQLFSDTTHKPDDSFSMMLSTMNPEQRQQFKDFPPERARDIFRRWTQARQDQMEQNGTT